MRFTKRQILQESGIRDINKLSQQYKKAEIYFHQDLDGVITALGMRHYLASKGITTVDAHIIQYGDKEFSVKRPTTDPEIMPVLVDFAHGKPEFKIWTDHHDSQAGDKTMGSGNFRQARSNAETISQIVSPQEIFPTSDILIVNTVDSADYAKHNINPEEVINSIFKYDQEKDVSRNKMLMGLVTNKLLLSYKNKPGFLEELVMTTTPSLHNLFHNIVKMAKREGYSTPERIAQTNLNYYEKRKDSSDVKFEDGIIISYGGGQMWERNPETGKADPNYDRYTVFRMYPDAEFNVIAWPMGLVQASCNPFKKERALKGVNLGEIAQEVLSKYEGHMKKNTIPLDKIKRLSEKSVVADSVGFRFSDLLSIYKDKVIGLDEVPIKLLKSTANKPYSSLTPEQKEILSKVSISVWDVLQANSGGHKCITNISGLNYLKDPVNSTKRIQNDFVRLLKQKIGVDVGEVSTGGDFATPKAEPREIGYNEEDRTVTYKYEIIEDGGNTLTVKNIESFPMVRRGRPIGPFGPGKMYAEVRQHIVTLPKSQIEVGETDSEGLTMITLPYWLYKKNDGLKYRSVDWDEYQPYTK